MSRLLKAPCTDWRSKWLLRNFTPMHWYNIQHGRKKSGSKQWLPSRQSSEKLDQSSGTFDPCHHIQVTGILWCGVPCVCCNACLRVSPSMTLLWKKCENLAPIWMSCILIFCLYPSTSDIWFILNHLNPCLQWCSHAQSAWKYISLHIGELLHSCKSCHEAVRCYPTSKQIWSKIIICWHT